MTQRERFAVAERWAAPPAWVVGVLAAALLWVGWFLPWGVAWWIAGAAFSLVPLFLVKFVAELVLRVVFYQVAPWLPK